MGILLAMVFVSVCADIHGNEYNQLDSGERCYYWQVILDANDDPLVLAKFGLGDYTKLDEKWTLKAYAKSKGKWNSVQTQIPKECSLWAVNAGGRINTYVLEQGERKGDYFADMTIYEISHEENLAFRKVKKFIFDFNDCKFPHESYRRMERVILRDDGQSVMFGEYVHSRSDPLTLLGRLMSGGHGGYSYVPFAATAGKSNIVSCRACPDKIVNNQNIVNSDFGLSDSRLYYMWVKTREYTDDSSVHISSYDLNQKFWRKPVNVSELFDAGLYFERLSLLCYNDTIFYACEASGDVYFMTSNLNLDFTRPELVAKSAGFPTLVSWKNKLVLFMYDNQDKGIFMKIRDHENWGISKYLSKDDLGYVFPSQHAISAVIDSKGFFHVVYHGQINNHFDGKLVYIYGSLE